MGYLDALKGYVVRKLMRAKIAADVSSCSVKVNCVKHPNRDATRYRGPSCFYSKSHPNLSSIGT